jgi:glycosyltransferase involved in cell wall biosynthesis
MSPKISVIMPVYNAGKYVKEAIESILHQTFVDFEFIIINDGSTDDSLTVIKSFNDYRIILIDQDNQGLIKSLNLGLSLAKGSWIARMDADDISYSNRFEEQIKLIDESIAVIGSQAHLIDANGHNFGTTNFALTHDKIYKDLVKHRSTVIHPSVLINKSLLTFVGGYDLKMKHIEDFDLWLRISKVGKLINVNKALLGLRKHESNISKIYLSTAIKNAYISLAYHHIYQSYAIINQDLYTKIENKIAPNVNYYAVKMVEFEKIKESIKQDANVNLKYFVFKNPGILLKYLILKFLNFGLLIKVKNLND